MERLLDRHTNYQCEEYVISISLSVSDAIVCDSQHVYLRKLELIKDWKMTSVKYEMCGSWQSIFDNYEKYQWRMCLFII